MPHYITKECLSCGICADECPQGAIVEGDETFIVDKTKCDDCGTCAEVCPNEGSVMANRKG